MKHRFLISALMGIIAIAALAVVAIPIGAQTPSAAAQAPRPPATAPAAGKAPAQAAKAWTPPKTSWGDPDLQGIYTSDDYIGLGLNRAAQYGNRLYFTEEEMAAREKTIAATAQRNSVEFATPGGNVGTGPPGHWGEGARRSPRQTSLIIEP